MSRKRYIYINNAATDAAYIDVDRVHDLEVTSATAFNINYKLNDNADGTTSIVATDATKAVKELVRLIAHSNNDQIVVADDTNSIYMAYVNTSGGTGAVGHS